MAASRSCATWWATVLPLLILVRFLRSSDAGLISGQATQRSDGLCASLVLPYRYYSCQEFVAQTSDGFLLGVQRLWRPEMLSGPQNGEPVLLIHGILTGGDVWVLNPPGEGLAFMLADAGYDVWISNYRSSAFSYGHLSYKPSDKMYHKKFKTFSAHIADYDNIMSFCSPLPPIAPSPLPPIAPSEGFWDWSVDNLASEDLTSSLQLVYSKTNQKLLLVAYSEGAQATLASFSEGLSSDLVKRAVLMAPVSYLTTGPQLIYIASKLRLQRIYEALNIYQLSTRSPGGREIVDLLCAKTSVKCYRDWFRVFSGYMCCINSTRRAFIDKYETQATSVKNLDHYTQQVQLGTFAKYDYGEAGNMERYKQASPPAYDLSKFPSDRLPTLFITSTRDSLANPTDVAHLFREIPAGYQLKTVQDFGHLDFVFGDTANRVVYDSVLEFLQAQ